MQKPVLVLLNVPKNCYTREIHLNPSKEMESFLSVLVALATATGLSGLIGLEREMRVQKRLVVESPIGGLSTFAMMGALGFLASFISLQYDLAWIMPAVFAGAIGFLLISHAYFVFNEHKFSAITAFALIVSFLIGILVAYHETLVAIAVSILFTGILALRDALHQMAKRINIDELLAILQFFIVTAIILPMLPKSYVDPFGFFDWRPQTVWLMVALVASIRFVGYFLAKVIGSDKSILLLGIVGGLISSTAVTPGIARESRDNKQTLVFLIPLLIATGLMIARVLGLVTVVTGTRSALFASVVWPLAVAIAICALLAIGLILHRQHHRHQFKNAAIEIRQPLQMSFALFFGGFFLLILLISEKIAAHFSDSGLYVTGAIAALTDVDAISLAMANLVKTEVVSATLAGRVILLAVIINTLVKVGIIFLFGSKKLLKAFTLSIGLVFFASAIFSSILWLLGN